MGESVFKRVRRESPASYLKVCAMLVQVKISALERAALSSFRCGKHAEHRESNRGTSSRA
jgi:hypothetical protein